MELNTLVEFLHQVGWKTDAESVINRDDGCDIFTSNDAHEFEHAYAHMRHMKCSYYSSLASGLYPNR